MDDLAIDTSACSKGSAKRHYPRGREGGGCERRGAHLLGGFIRGAAFAK